jgi:hypothetical protein
MSITTSMMEPLGFWFKNLDQVEAHPSALSLVERREQSPDQPFQPRREMFSEADLDALLKKAGLKPSPRLREIAQFLISNRFELSSELVQKVQQLLPEGPYYGQKAEALVAALAKLPLEQVQRGFEILLSTLNAEHPTVTGALKNLVSQLSDVISELRLYQGHAIQADVLKAAFSEELQQWQQVVSKPELQLLALLNRQNLVQDLRRYIHLSQWASKILEHLESKSSEGLRRRMLVAEKAAGHAAKVMLADGIMSKPDDFRHMRDHGLCYSLGLDWEDELVPCRLWAFDDQHTENLALDEKNVHLFFRVVGESLGLVEIELVIESEELRLRFFSPAEEIRGLMNREAESLKQHLLKLGYEVTIHPAQSKLRQADPKVELESRNQEMVHMDVKA